MRYVRLSYWQASFQLVSKHMTFGYPMKIRKPIVLAQMKKAFELRLKTEFDIP